MERGEIAARRFAGGNLVEQGPGEARPRDQDLERRRAIGGVERAVVPGQRLADLRIVKEGQSAHGRRRSGNGRGPAARRSTAGRLGRLSINVRSAAFRVSSSAFSSSASRLTSSRARPSPKSTFSSRTPGAKRPVGRRVELAWKASQASGFLRLATAGQGVDQAADHLGPELGRPARQSRRATRSTGAGRASMSSPSLRAISRTTAGMPAVGRQRGERRRIGVGDRDQAGPDQGRQVVVRGVLGVRQERPGQLDPALRPAAAAASRPAPAAPGPIDRREPST